MCVRRYPSFLRCRGDGCDYVTLSDAMFDFTDIPGKYMPVYRVKFTAFLAIDAVSHIYRFTKEIIVNVCYHTVIHNGDPCFFIKAVDLSGAVSEETQVYPLMGYGAGIALRPPGIKVLKQHPGTEDPLTETVCMKIIVLFKECIEC